MEFSKGRVRRYVKHGHARNVFKGKRSRELTTWKGMWDRCTTTTNSRYPLYGARGIKVCKRWESFETFLADMGQRPAGKTLDRIDNNGNYEPGNCRWATQTEQLNNRRGNHFIEFAGKSQTITVWAREKGMRRSTLNTRLLKGWTVERALTEPVAH